MADFSPFAPKPLDLSGVAALLGPTGGEAGFIRQAEGRRVNLQPLMNQEMGQRDATLQQVYGANESDNAIKAIMMQAALQDSARGQDADIVKAIGPALINHGESSQVGNLGPAHDLMIDPDMFFKQSVPHDSQQMAKDAANTFLMNQQGNAAPVNAAAAMIAANAAKTRAAKTGGMKFTYTDMGFGTPAMQGSTNDPTQLGDVAKIISQQRNTDGTPQDPSSVDYEHTGTGAQAFVTSLTKHGGAVLSVQKNMNGSGKDLVTTSVGVYLVDPATGLTADVSGDDSNAQDDNAE